MQLNKYDLNGEKIVFRMRCEYNYYIHGGLASIERVYAATSINNSSYKGVNDINWNNIHGLIAGLLLIYNYRYKSNIRMDTCDSLKIYIGDWLSRGDINYCKWIYDLEKNPRYDFDINKLEKVFKTRMRNLFPYSDISKFINFPSYNKGDEDTDDVYEIYCEYVEKLANEFIEQQMNIIHHYMREDKLDEYNPFNLMNKEFKIRNLPNVKIDDDATRQDNKMDRSTELGAWIVN